MEKYFIYKEIQYFKTIIVLFSVIMIGLSILYAFKLGSPGKVMTLKAFIFFEAVCLFVLVLLYKMVIEIKEGILTITFGIGIIKKRIDIDSIKKNTIVIRKVPFYHGVGIRFTRYGTLFNTTWGDTVVFSTRKENKSFAIGTQKASKLMEVLQ